MSRSSARRRDQLPPRRPRPTQPQRRETRRSLELPAGIAEVYSIPGYAILPLRFFLGFTFLYAGIQKLTDPGFFTLGSNTYIGTQLLNFSRHSPIQFLLKHFLEHAVAIGVLTIITELVIGALVVLGLFTRLAALGGLVLNLVFFLSASWNVYPYFLGSDIVFVMGWLTLAIAGPGGFALDPIVRKPVAEIFSRPLERLMLGSFFPLRTEPPVSQAADEPAPIRPEPSPTALRLSRREAVIAGFATAVLVILGLGPRAKFGAGSGVAAGTASSSNVATPPAGQSSGSAPQPTAPASGSANGTKVGTVSQIPVNSALAATDPNSGDPAVIVHTAGSNFVAYDAVCTHAGCTVQYDPQYKYLICPCHGGAFDPANGGQVVAGPPPAPLTSLPIKIDSQGNIYLT